MGSKLKVALILLLLFGAPALVTTALITSDFQGEPTSGAQPGGVISGVVTDEHEAALSGIELDLAVFSPASARQSVARATTDAQGRFELRAPPCNGHYELRAGGGSWQWLVRGVSFLDRNGKTIEPAPLALKLTTGCQLELGFARSDGRPVDDGEYVLDGEFGQGYLFGLIKKRLKTSGSVRAGMIRLDALPPMKARLDVRFASGETVELDLDLAPGLHRKTIEL